MSLEIFTNYKEKNPRFLQEEGLEKKIATLILPTIEDLDYQLVRIKFLNHNRLILQIMIERCDGSMTVEDCEKLSYALSPILDSEDIINQPYHLEISSPGIDRPLVRILDFQNWQQHLIKIEIKSPAKGKKRYKGIITSADQEGFHLKSEHNTEDCQLYIRYDDLLSAKLVLTDRLIQDIFTKNKKNSKI